MPGYWKCSHCGRWTSKRSWNCNPFLCTGKHKVCSSKCRQTCKIEPSLLPLSQEEIQLELAKRFSQEFLDEIQSQHSSQELLSSSTSQDEEIEFETPFEKERKESGKCEKVCSCNCTCNSTKQGNSVKDVVTHSKNLSAGDSNQVLKGKEKGSPNGRSLWEEEDITKLTSYTLIPTRDWITGLIGRTCSVENCTGKVKFLKYWTEGFFELVGLQCNECASIIFVYNSPPKRIGKKGKNGFRMINIEAVASHLFAGKTLTSYWKETNMNEFIKPIGHGSWQRIEDYIWECVEKVAARKNAELAKELEKRSFLILEGDGAWAHRRNSGQGVYSVLDSQTGKCIFRHVMVKSRHFQKKEEWGSEVWEIACEGNHSSTSHSMEVIGFLNFVDWMKENSLIPKWKIFVHDQDGKIGALFKDKLLPELEHVTLLNDPGHIRKNFKKKLTGVFGETSRYKSFPGRISRMWMRCLKSAEEKALASWADRAKEANTDPNIVTEESVSWKMAQTTRHFLDLWQKILPHYTRAICPEDCPCNYLPYLVSSAKIKGTENGGLFATLPLEMLVAIFQYINDPKTLAVLTMTCKFMLSTLAQSRKAIKIKPKSRIWLDLSNKKDKKKYDKLQPVMAEMNSLATVYCHCYATCRVETLNWVTSAFCPKTTEFWKRYRQRVVYVTLHFNADSLEELYSEIMQEIGIPASETLKLRWKSADEKRAKEKAWNKSIEKKRRKLQLELHTAHRRIQEKAESARLTKQRELNSIEYSQGDIYTSIPSESPSTVRSSTSPTSIPSPSSSSPSAPSVPSSPCTSTCGEKVDLQVVREEKWERVLEKIRDIGLAQSEGGKKFGRNELRERLAQYLLDPNKHQHFLRKRKSQNKTSTKEKTHSASSGTINLPVG